MRRREDLPEPEFPTISRFLEGGRERLRDDTSVLVRSGVDTVTFVNFIMELGSWVGAA